LEDLKTRRVTCLGHKIAYAFHLAPHLSHLFPPSFLVVFHRPHSIIDIVHYAIDLFPVAFQTLFERLRRERELLQKLLGRVVLLFE
jgi:hypothetical protein